MMDTVDNGHDHVQTVKWIMVLLYALSTVFEPIGVMPVENL